MKILIIILTVLITNNLLAQDIIIKSNGTKINAKVTEVLSTEIKYKRFDNLNGPDYIISKEELTKIKYENGQEDIFYNLNPRKDNRFGINVYMGGPTTVVSLSLDYFVIPNINIETGAGILGYYGGLKYHIFGNRAEKNWTPYVGLFRYSNPFLGYTGLYIPAGIHYIDKQGTAFGLEVAAVGKEGWFPVWGAIKIGYHF